MATGDYRPRIDDNGYPLPDVCPHCGYCHHCGQAPQRVVYEPYVPAVPSVTPVYPGWWSITPPPVWGTTTVTNGNAYTNGTIAVNEGGD